MESENFLITDYKKVWTHFGKTEETVDKDVKIIKNWIKSNHYFPEIPDDIMIQHFLTNCNFSIERTKQCLDMYYAVRIVVPEMYNYTNPTSSYMAAAYELILCCPLPRLTDQLERILFLKLNDGDLQMFNINKAMALVYNNVSEVRIWEDLTLGDKIVGDLKDMKIGHVKKIFPSDVRKLGFILENVWNLKIKEIHFFNVPRYAEKVIKLCKTLFNKKLGEKIFVHNSIEDIYKIVPKEILPKEYGGNEKSLQELNDIWLKKMKQYEDRFTKLENMDINNFIRPEFGSSDISGYFGNYMKLEME
uniref:Alpha-tocopherol transfer protein-like n=1 Tax=Diabrotica virgifera virgifera TaxID=50390 RepID=A0A6P7GM15_DIAVI